MSEFEAPAPKFKADGETISNGKTVLVVDDDPIFRKTTGIKLHFSGYEVRTAKENSEAIEALGREPIAAVIMDIEFPADACNGGMGSWDGFQMMEWMRGLPVGYSVPFIMVSNTDSDAYRQRAKKLGAVVFLQKPLDYEQLIEVLNEVTKVRGKAPPSTAPNAKATLTEPQRARAAKALAESYAALRPSVIR